MHEPYISTEKTGKCQVNLLLSTEPKEHRDNAMMPSKLVKVEYLLVQSISPGFYLLFLYVQIYITYLT